MSCQVALPPVSKVNFPSDSAAVLDQLQTYELKKNFYLPNEEGVDDGFLQNLVETFTQQPLKMLPYVA